MSAAAVDRYDLRGASTFAPPLALAGLTTFLFIRLLPGVSGKPLHEDEAVAGLISARPLGDVLHTVVFDRGGAPLHFVLAHLALSIDDTPDALRWLSVVFALATVPLCYDLARRLAGRLAGLTAAALAATSQLLAVYGTFGRMYSLFACAGALAADLFVRALDRSDRRTALAAAAAALVAPPAALALARTMGSMSDRLGPRHLIFMLPLWIALVAAGVARSAQSLPPRARLAPVVAVATVALVAPTAIAEPRTIATGDANAVAAPAAWLGRHVERGDVLYPYSPVFLAALPNAAHARGYSREPVALARAARRTHEVPAVLVSLPLHRPLGGHALVRLRRARVDAHAFASWLILEARGPFTDGRDALGATTSLLGRASPVLARSAPMTDAFLQQLYGTACDALTRLHTRCD